MNELFDRQSVLPAILALAVSLLVSFALTPAVKRLAVVIGAVDVPKDKRRMHDHPIPRLGGLAIFIGFVISALLFALFYGVIDLLGWRRWAFYFRVIGLNSITIYLVQKFVDMKYTRDFFFGGLAGLLPEAWGRVVLAVGYLVIGYLFLKYLYDKKIFLKV